MNARRKVSLIIAMIMIMALAMGLVACSVNKVEITSPSNEATEVSVMPTITWKADEKAEWYDVLISEKQDITNPVVSVTQIKQLSYTLTTALKNETKYYLVVIANGAEYTAQSCISFTTMKHNVNPPIDLNTPKTIYDFNYADVDAVKKVWTVHGGGDPAVLEVVDSAMPSGGKALKVTTNSEAGVGIQGWTQLYSQVPAENYVWAGRTGIKLWLKSNGDGVKFRILFEERLEEVWIADISLNAKYEGFVEIPFSSFVCGCSSGEGYGDHIMQLDGIKKVGLATIGYVNSGYTVDEFSIIPNATDTRSLVEDTSGDTRFVPNADYENFESYADGAALGASSAGVWKAGAVTLDATPLTIESNGINGKSLSVKKLDTQIIHVPNKYNWSSFKGIKLTAKATNGATGIYVQLKDKDGENYVQHLISVGEVAKTFEINFKDFTVVEGKGKVNFAKIEFIKLYILNNYDGGSVVLDDIKLSDTEFVVDTTKCVIDDFSTYSNTAALQAVWNGAPVLLEENGAKVMSVVEGTANVYSNQSADISKFNSLKITYYTLTGFELGISSYVNGGVGLADFSTTMKFEACTNDYKTATVRFMGGAGSSIANLQLKAFGANTKIAKIEFVVDDSAPQLKYAATKDSITIDAVVGAEYSKDGGTTWQENNVFTALTAGQTYSMGIRYKAVGIFVASKIATTNVQLVNIQLAAPFMNNMVLQRGKGVRVWGVGEPSISYTLTFNTQTKTAVADSTGKFEFILDAMVADKVGKELIISDGVNSTKISNVVVGEVWVMAGQSNMQMWLATTDKTQADLDLANSGDIRLFKQDMVTSPTAMTKFVGGEWFVATSGNVSNYSALGFMYAVNLYEKLGKNVPIGIVYAASGGTDIEAWISANNYTGANSAKNENYNAMIAPMAGMTVGGVAWYQGENNANRAMAYSSLLTALVKDWRQTFNDPSLYFMIIQLPKFDNTTLGSNVNWAYLREAQANAVAGMTNCDLIVTIDGGNLTDIHPTQKRYIALRMVDMAMYRLFGGVEVGYPTYDSSVVVGNTIEVTLKNATKLYSGGQAIIGFEVAGADYKYYIAKAELVNGKIVVSSSEVLNPLYVRYSWSSVGGGSLFNGQDLPLAPFRTDNDDSMLIDDFSNYADNTALSKTWSAHNSTVTLENAENGKAIKVLANVADGQASIALGADWTGYNTISLRFKVSKNFGKMTVGLDLGTGKDWPYFVVTGNGEWQTVRFKISKMQGVENYNSYVSSLIIKAPINGEWVMVSNITVSPIDVEIDANPTPVDVVYEDFNNYANEADLQKAWGANAKQAEISAGKKGVKIEKVDQDTQIQKDLFNANWKSFKSIAVTFKTSANNISFYFTLNVDSSVGKYAYKHVVGNGQKQTIIFPIASMGGDIAAYTGTVNYLMIKADVANSWVMVEKIELIVDERTQDTGANPMGAAISGAQLNGATFDVKYGEIIGATSFIIELSETNDFAAIIASNTTNGTFNTNLITIGAKYFVRIVATNSNGSTTTTGEFVLSKGEQPKPTLAYNLDTTTLTIVPVVGAEYSKDAINWQDSNVFANLVNGSQYTIAIRMKETAIANASEIASAVVTIGKAEQAAPSVPTLTNKTTNSITAQVIVGAEYKLDDGIWQDSNIFEGLVAGSSHILYVRMKETVTHNASQASSLQVVLDKIAQTAPTAYVVNNTFDTITIESIVGAEYSIDNGVTWQTSGLFTGLTSGNYNVTVRLAETATHSVSANAAVKVVDTRVILFDDFNNYASDVELQAVWTSGTVAPTLVTVLDNKCMMIYGTNSNMHANKAFAKSLGIKTIVITYATNASGSVEILLGNGDGPNYGNACKKVLLENTNGALKQLKIDISSFAADYNGNHLANVQIKTPTTDVKIQKIYFTQEKVETIYETKLVDDFTTYADSAALNSKWAPYNATVELASNAMKITNNGDGAQAQYNLNVAGLHNFDADGYKSISIRFRTNVEKGEFHMSLSNNTYAIVKGSTKWQTMVLPISSLEGAATAKFDGVEYMMLKPQGLNNWIEVSEIKLLYNEQRQASFYMFEDFNVKGGWSNGTAATVDGNTVLNTVPADNYGATQLTNGSQNCFHKVKSVKIRFKAAQGQTIKFLISNWGGQATSDCQIIINGTGDWAEVEFNISQLTNADVYDFGWVACLFLNGSGETSFDYIMLSEQPCK